MSLPPELDGSSTPAAPAVPLDDRTDPGNDLQSLQGHSSRATDPSAHMARRALAKNAIVAIAFLGAPLPILSVIGTSTPEWTVGLAFLGILFLLLGVGFTLNAVGQGIKLAIKNRQWSWLVAIPIGTALPGAVVWWWTAVYQVNELHGSGVPSILALVIGLACTPLTVCLYSLVGPRKRAVEAPARSMR